MGKQLSDSTRARIVQLRDEGFSVVAIADRTALAEKTIRQVINKADQTPDTRPVRKTYSAQKRRASWLKIQGWRLMDIDEATGLEPGEVEKNWKAWALMSSASPNGCFRRWICRHRAHTLRMLPWWATPFPT